MSDNKKDRAAVFIEDSCGDLTGAQITGSGGDGLAIRGKSRVIFDKANLSNNAGKGLDIRGGAQFSGIDAIIEGNQSVDALYQHLGLSRSEIDPSQLESLVRTAIDHRQQNHDQPVIEQSLQRAATAVGLAAEPYLAAVAIILSASLEGLRALANKLNRS